MLLSYCTGYRLEGQATDSTLELRRLEVWDPAAKVVVHPGGGTKPTTQGPPDVRYFKGSVAGAPGSTVVLAVDAAGGVSGVATHGSERWALGRPALSPVAAAAGVAPAGLSSRKVPRSGSGAAPRPPFQCGADALPPQHSQRAQQASSQDGGASRKLLAVSCKTPTWPAGGCRVGGHQAVLCLRLRAGLQAPLHFGHSAAPDLPPLVPPAPPNHPCRARLSQHRLQ